MKMNGKLIGKWNAPDNPQTPSGIWYTMDEYTSSLEKYWPTFYPITNTWQTSKIGFGTEKKLLVTVETNPQGFCFGNNGTRLYVVGSVANAVRQYNLSTAWDISTAVYTKQFSTGTLNMASIFINPTGDRMFILGVADDLVRSYSLSTAWEVDSASAITTFSVTGGDATPWGMTFSTDGLNMYIVGITSDTVRQYILGTAWNIATISAGTFTYSRTTSLTVPREVRFSSNGLKMFVIDSDTDNTRVFTLTTAWRIDTADVGTNFYHYYEPPGDIIVTAYGVDFSSDGTKMYILDLSTDTIFQLELKTAYDPLDPYTVEDQTTATSDLSSTGLYIREDGRKMYIAGTAADAITEYDLPTPWTISTKTLVGSATRTLNPGGIFFKPNGSSIFVVSIAGALEEYNLSRVWDVSSAGAIAVRSATITGGFGLFFDSTGTYMYSATQSSTISRYTLTTPWNIATAGSLQSLTVTNQASATGVALSSDGLQLYVIGESRGNIIRYKLSSAWTLTGATAIDSIDIEGIEASAKDIKLGNNGVYLYYVGQTTDTVRRLTISSTA